MTDDLFVRHAGNPILTAADWPTPVNSVFNPGVARVGNETLLLARVEDKSGRSHLAVATSSDGITGWTIDPTRALLADFESEAERNGIEDPRITRIGDEYLILYTGFSSSGPLVCLAATRDFRRYDRRGVVLAPENKDAALFPEKIGGRYVMFHRPVATATADMWLAWSPDLIHWGNHSPVLLARGGGWWDSAKIGAGPPPLLTGQGWLVLYHGVRVTPSGSIYRLGLALLDREHPERVLAQSDDWAFGPQELYERVGDVGNVVFSCGWLLLEDGDTVQMYYGAADTTICLATASLTALLASLG